MTYPWTCVSAPQVLTAHDASVEVVCLDTQSTALFSGDARGSIYIWSKSDGGKGAVPGACQARTQQHGGTRDPLASHLTQGPGPSAA
jgi:hypothetical protein